MKRKILMISSLIAILISTSIINTYVVKAEDGIVNDQSELKLVDYEKTDTSSNSDEKRYADMKVRIKEEIVKGATNRNKGEYHIIDLTDLSTIEDAKDSSKFNELYFEVLDENPEIFYCYPNASIAGGSYNTNSDTYFSNCHVEVRYLYTADEIDKVKTEFTKGINNCIEDIKKNLSENPTDLEIEYAVHDYIIENCEYVENNFNLALGTCISQTAYGPIVNKTAVCNGYAKANMLLLNKLSNNIDAGIVKNIKPKVAHGWNYVNINGKYYETDLTWDDTNSDVISYLNFNCSSDVMEKIHEFSAESKIPGECDDTTYDNMFRSGDGSLVIRNYAARIKGKIYYVDGNDLYSCDLDGGNSKKEDFTILPDGDIKAYLIKGIGTVQKDINNTNVTDVKTLITNAINAVEKAEKSQLQDDVKSAKVLVTALGDGTDKTNLVSRLDAVQEAIDKTKVTDTETLITSAINAVVKAENSQSQVDLNSAKALVTALADGTDKTNLVSRLDTVQKAINPTKATGSTETTASTNSSLKSVSISGTEEVDCKLKAKVKYGGTEPSLKYQWLRASKKDGDFKEISGANEEYYKLKNTDNNKYIKLVVTENINGQTYSVEDITSKIDRDTSDDDDTSSKVSNSNYNGSSNYNSSSNSNNSNDTIVFRPSTSTSTSSNGEKSSMYSNTNSNLTSKGRFTNPSGIPVRGWINSNGGRWYYLDGNGFTKIGWVQDNGKWYYMDSDGAMVSNTTIEGYKIGSDGVCIY